MDKEKQPLNKKVSKKGDFFIRYPYLGVKQLTACLMVFTQPSVGPGIHPKGKQVMCIGNYCVLWRKITIIYDVYNFKVRSNIL